MLPISKMELVVFAVVLILPALLRGGFLSGTEMNDCMEILADCGEMKCLLEGSGNFSNFDPQYCTFICEGRPTPPLPRRICSGNKIKCTSSVREDLRNLRQKLEHAIYLVLSERCPSFSN
uniref:Putative conserved secreted protein n=1 Tax=Ixodes ricinus TaxID=34613 RepID=A0A6B0UMC6_IXORI